MDTTIYYFTGTGNSLYIAREIARHLPGKTTLVPIPALMNRGGEITAPAGRVGFAFPVYAGGPPLMVAEFARRIDLSAAEQTFAVVTMGSAGDAAYWRRSLRSGGTVWMPGIRLQCQTTTSSSRTSTRRCRSRR